MAIENLYGQTSDGAWIPIRVNDQGLLQLGGGGGGGGGGDGKIVDGQDGTTAARVLSAAPGSDGGQPGLIVRIVSSRLPAGAASETTLAALLALSQDTDPVEVTGDLNATLGNDNGEISDTNPLQIKSISPTRGFAVTPHASNALPSVTRSLYVGGAGNIVLRLTGDSADLTLVAVPAGTTLSLSISHIRATSTATNMVGFYG